MNNTTIWTDSKEYFENNSPKNLKKINELVSEDNFSNSDFQELLLSMDDYETRQLLTKSFLQKASSELIDSYDLINKSYISEHDFIEAYIENWYNNLIAINLNIFENPLEVLYILLENNHEETIKYIVENWEKSNLEILEKEIKENNQYFIRKSTKSSIDDLI